MGFRVVKDGQRRPSRRRDALSRVVTTDVGTSEGTGTVNVNRDTGAATTVAERVSPTGAVRLVYLGWTNRGSV